MSGGATWLGRCALAAALAALAIWLSVRPAAHSPADVVAAWYDAMARGDEAAAIRLTSGAMRRALESQLRLSSPDRRIERLGLNDVRGVAVRTLDSSDANTAEVEVELVFEDRNERQRVRLERQGRNWFIVEFGSAAHVVPPVRYGTPAFD